MSEQGLEVLDATYQKAQEWISKVAEVLHLDKGDAYKALRAVLLTLRDRLPPEEAVHFGAQLPMLLRGLYYEGWKPLQTPIKMSYEEFLQAVQEKIVMEGVVDPIRFTQGVLFVASGFVSAGELDKIWDIMPKDLQTLWQPPAN
jgi:uncharacterized protein (DUF2267 family)